jgi:hypothetical protein
VRRGKAGDAAASTRGSRTSCCIGIGCGSGDDKTDRHVGHDNDNGSGNGNNGMAARIIGSSYLQCAWRTCCRHGRLNSPGRQDRHVRMDVSGTPKALDKKKGTANAVPFPR